VKPAATVGSGEVDPKSDLSRSAADHQSVRSAFIRGLGWTSIAKWAGQLISWPATILIARHLVPSDYGYLALVSVWTRLIMLLTEGGFSAAIVLGPPLSDRALRQLNSLAVMLGVCAALLGFALAVPISIYYHSPPMRWVMIAISTTFLWEGLMLVPTALLRRKMRFRDLGIVDICRTIADASVGLTLAFAGFGYWALVAQYWAGVAAAAIMAGYFARLRWERPDMSQLRPTVSLARVMLSPSIAEVIYGGAGYLVAGRFLGPAVAGVYGLAWTIVAAPGDKLVAILTRVAPSLFGSMSSEPKALAHYCVRITHALAIFLLPCFAGMAVTAPIFVPLLLGEKWSDVVGPLQFLCAHAAMVAVFSVVPPTLQAAGQGRAVVRASVFAIGLYVPSFFLFGNAFGARGLALAWCLGTPLWLSLLWSTLDRAIDLPKGSLIRILGAPALSTTVMIAATLAIQDRIRAVAGPIATLGLTIAAGAVIYAGTFAALDWRTTKEWIDRVFARRAIIGITPVR
jgi:O-antigen/teichoic acid export membrane protein